MRNVTSGLGDSDGAQSLLSCPCRAGRCRAVSLRGRVRLARPAGPPWPGGGLPPQREPSQQVWDSPAQVRGAGE